MPTACPLPLRPFALALALCATPLCADAQADTAPGAADDQVAMLGAARIEITSRHYDNAVGSSDAASQGTIRAELLKSRPALRPGEVLEFVPGVIVTQHSGDGKANQYFLRGFNLDHGTDFATTVDGMPVNMPSHGHGQGYSDLNFLIPELVDHIAYRKGPYFATHGDFASAGAADIHYVQTLAHPFAQLTLGENGYRRGVGGASLDIGPGLRVLGAAELMHNDGPWTVPEGLRRANAVLGLSQGDKRQGFSAGLMAYDARWTSTDQIPQRLIDAGEYNGRPFDRFDSLDPSDGGRTSRTSLNADWHGPLAGGEARVAGYAMHYTLALYSNFTYAMERPDTGDQFAQQDERDVYGLSASQAWSHALGGLDARSELGLQLRHDRARVGLYTTQERRIVDTTRLDDVEETMTGLYAQTSINVSDKLRGVFGLRWDQGDFTVAGLSSAANSGHARASQLSPKLALVGGPWAKTEVFFNAGRGFHSNDARGTTDPLAPVPGLVSSRGWELGLRTEALPGLQSSLALWTLNFDSELVYVGDAGATEASAASRRRGIEWNNRWTPSEHFLLDADLAWTHARFSDGARIPNAVDSVASVAATLKDFGPWSASLQWRYLGTGALVEDNAVRSRPSSTFNLRVTNNLRGLTGWPAELTLDVFNLFDAKVNDIQYYYESQLPGETAPVLDRIVHPAEPRTLRLTLRATF
ncbi:TonB-dependent receptor [Ideonella sp.]|uniref:TonB-dependent receptor n=1 Tax=Ideonella sp. TaxID=1929293 RepID=UPI0035B21430